MFSLIIAASMIYGSLWATRTAIKIGPAALVIVLKWKEASLERLMSLGIVTKSDIAKFQKGVLTFVVFETGMNEEDLQPPWLRDKFVRRTLLGKPLILLHKEHQSLLTEFYRASEEQRHLDHKTVWETIKHCEVRRRDKQMAKAFLGNS